MHLSPTDEFRLGIRRHKTHTMFALKLCNWWSMRNLSLSALLALLSLSLTTNALAVTPAPAPAANSSVPAQPAPATADTTEDKGGPPSIFDDGQPRRTQSAMIAVRLHTARSKNSIDSYTLYPYPMKPPVCAPTTPLSTNPKALMNSLLYTGYHHRSDPEKHYQNGGWRWVLAYEAARRKSGNGEPHTILTEYPWAHDMIPYVIKECKARNDLEAERLRRYQKATDEWERTHTDIENDAIRQGLMPIALSHREWSIGRGHFPPGNWWVQVTRKMPGLTYYWLQPVTAAPGQSLDITLSDENALAITGSAW
jgi:hypothetical protein